MDEEIHELEAQLVAANKRISDLKTSHEQSDAKILELIDQVNYWKGMSDTEKEKNTQLVSEIELLAEDFNMHKQKNDKEANHWKQKFQAATKENVNLKSSIKRFGSISKQAEKNEYEVDSLLDHKRKDGHMCYLIRWKGYDPEFDTWERESNLRCTNILNRYKKAHQIV